MKLGKIFAGLLVLGDAKRPRKWEWADYKECEGTSYNFMKFLGNPYILG